MFSSFKSKYPNSHQIHMRSVRLVMVYGLTQYHNRTPHEILVSKRILQLIFGLFFNIICHNEFIVNSKQNGKKNGKKMEIGSFNSQE